jgi:hypothetical protein
MNDKIPKAIRTLNFHGVNAKEGASGEWIGNCPFCGKAKHLYVKPDRELWQCKVCGAAGNTISFLEQLHAHLSEVVLDDGEWDQLVASRRMPKDLLEEAGLVMDRDGDWLLPCRAETGAIHDLRKYDGKQLMSTAGCEVQLFGSDLLAKTKTNTRVHLCEGEWDGLAMRWLLREAGLDNDVAVAVPGASTFKKQWARLFSGKKVVCYYDQDEAGDVGAEKAQKELTGTAKEISFVNWPDTLPTGYDLRDFVAEKLPELGAQECLKQLEALRESAPRRSADRKKSAEKPKAGKLAASIQEVMAAFERRMKMTDDLRNALRMSLAVVLSNDISGDPLWVYLVGPPGCGKTMILSSLAGSDRCELRSTLTPHSLVSGWQGSGGDPSLIPKLSGLTLIAKDFTEVLSMQKPAQDEVFSTLRGAYDGTVLKSFGNGVERRYDDCRFSLLAGVTNVIHAHRGASLGERFLKLSIAAVSGQAADELIEAAVHAIGQEKEAEEELRQVVASFLTKKLDPKALPRLTVKQGKRLTALVQLTAVLRAAVERDQRSGDMLYRPGPETGTRLAKQLAKMAMCLAAVDGDRGEVGNRAFAMVEKMAKDTAHGFYLDIVDATMALGGSFTKSEVAKTARLPVSTAWRQVEDLQLLGVVELTDELKDPGPSGGAPAKVFKVTAGIEKLWEQGDASWLSEINGSSSPQPHGKPALKLSRKRLVLRRPSSASAK